MSTRTAAMPSLFVSHGAPTFALEPGASGAALAAWAQRQVPRPHAVVVLSPHWMAAQSTVMTTAQPRTWHDFGGFDPALYALQYPARGAPTLAHDILALLADAGIAAQGDDQRPYDHGAWVPLRHLYPQADVPVLQVALPAVAGPGEVYALGAALRALRTRGVLLLGSGSMTHNLGEFSGAPTAPAPYVQAFCRWVEDALVRGDRAALFDYRRCAPHALRAHPTDEHFLPLFFALGAAGWGQGTPVAVDYLGREVRYGMLAMDALALA